MNARATKTITNTQITSKPSARPTTHRSPNRRRALEGINAVVGLAAVADAHDECADEDDQDDWNDEFQGSPLSA